MRGVTARDAEMLRTLLRVQLATTASLQRAFFPSRRPAQRRLQHLTACGLVERHNRGLPRGLHGPAYWRLSRAGLQLVAERFVAEPIPDNAIDRAASASLRFFEHRDWVTDLYLELVGDKHQDVTTIAAHADSIRWLRERDVVLDVAQVGRSRQLIPDATIEAPACAARFFVELDRSTESTKRCAATLRRYASHVRSGQYAARFGDDAARLGGPLAPHVLYVTKSLARQRSLRATFGPVALGQLSAVVLEQSAAVAWLRDALFGKGAGLHLVPAPSDADAVLSAALDHLGRVYNAYRDELCHRTAAGESVEPPGWMHAVLAFLEQHREHG